MGHAGFVVFVETGLCCAVKWAVQIFAPLRLDQMDNSVLECLASHKSTEREIMSQTCQERKKMVWIITFTTKCLVLENSSNRTVRHWNLRRNTFRLVWAVCSAPNWFVQNKTFDSNALNIHLKQCNNMSCLTATGLFSHTHDFYENVHNWIKPQELQ